MTLTRLPLAFRNLIFVMLQPGIVAGVIPYILTKHSMSKALTDTFMFHHYLGISTFLAGVFIMFHCIVRFSIDGLGTLSPADPTKKLVTSGLYRFSRNPMYVGVMLILIGETFFTLSTYLLFYSIGIFVLFNFFIAYREEPRLKKDFGRDYEIYSKNVKRWM